MESRHKSIQVIYRGHKKRTNMVDRTHRAFRIIFVLTLLMTSSMQLAAQNKYEFWPGANYERRIPSFRDVLGYEPGERITTHSGLMKYMEALASAAPNQVKIFEYARSWEGGERAGGAGG